MKNQFKFSMIAPAKLNLFLKVVGKFNQDYHSLISLVGFTEFGDIIHFKSESNDSIKFIGPFSKDFNHKDNFISKAKELFKKEGFLLSPINIVVEKNIPIGSGLGGGSADAACCINAFSKISQKKIPKNIVYKIAEKIGSDVPVCIKSKWSVISEKGTKLKNIDKPNTNDIFCVIVKPSKSLSTKLIFSKVKNFSTIDLNYIYTLLKKSDLDNLINVGNDLSGIATKEIYEIKNIFNIMETFKDEYGQDIIGFSMTGSGSACFALVTNHMIANKLTNSFQKLNFWSIVTKFI
tara:strand:- start:120 stop:995 length:876 start_codon:yes stop_codon:yes gene_type:complete